MVSGKPDVVKVVICGAGPAGLLLSHYLLSHGNGRFHVSLFERGDDPREVYKRGTYIRGQPMGINMRGIRSLRCIPGLFEKVEKLKVQPTQVCVFVVGKLCSMTQGRLLPGFLVDRYSLCSVMLQHLVDSHQDSGLLDLHFLTPCTGVDLSSHRATFHCNQGPNKDEKQGKGGGADGKAKLLDLTYDLLVGADGVRSTVRLALQSQTRNFNLETRDIFTRWHTVQLPRPTSVPPNTMILVPKVPASSALQAIGLPAVDGSLSLLWGWPLSSHPDEWYACKTPAEAKRYVDDRLPFLEISEEKAWEFLKQPAATTMQVKCWTYHDEQHGRSVLVGDAAHATAPTIGNGCNLSLLDVSVLARLLLGCDVGESDRLPVPPLPSPLPVASMTAENIRARMPAVLRLYSALQVKEGHALVDLSDAYTPFDNNIQIWNALGMVLRQFLSRLLPWLIHPPVLKLVNIRCLEFHKVYDLYHRDTEYVIRSKALYRNRWYIEQWTRTLEEGLGPK